MKVLASLSRVVFSLIVLIALACYLQNEPTISLENFCASITPEQLLNLLNNFNTVSLLFVVILLLGMLPFTRVLEAVWNVVFCASVLLLLAIGLYETGGPLIALPKVLHDNDAINQLCQAITSYEVPLAITVLVFIAGWLCASACGRVAITTVVSYGLWYATTAFFTYAVQLWANSDSPRMPEALNMVQGTPWIVAAVPGAFFLIYALFMAFFETFISTKSAKRADKQDEKEEKPTASEKKTTDNKKPVEEEKKETPEQAVAEKKPAQNPAEPVSKSQPLLKVAPGSPARKLKLATPSAPVKPETKSDSEPEQTKAEKEENTDTGTVDTPIAETKKSEPEEALKTEVKETPAANEPEKKSDEAPANTENKA